MVFVYLKPFDIPTFHSNAIKSKEKRKNQKTNARKTIETKMKKKCVKGES